MIVETRRREYALGSLTNILEGERKRRGGGTYRPPANSSLFVHNLKGPTAFAFAWEHMQEVTRPYDHAACVAHWLK